MAEAYYRLVLHPAFAATLDVQYMADDYRGDPSGPRGWILGLRVDSAF